MRLSKQLSVFSWALLGAFALSGCNGAADGTDTDDGTVASYGLTLSYQTFANGQCADATTSLSFASNSRFCAVATLTQGSSKLSGQLVSFSATLGTVSPATKLTDANGVAQVIVSNPDLTAAAGVLSATYTPTDADALLVNRNYEFIGNDNGTSDGVVKLSASILSSGAAVTRFKIDEAVQLHAVLLDSQSQGIADQKVTFSAGAATLNPASSLTNSQGIAQVSYTPSDGELGANALTVSVDYQNQTLQTSSLYEVLSKDATSQEGVIKFGSLDASGNFTEGKLASSLTPDTDGKYKLSAGGSFGITANLVLEAADGSVSRLQTPASVSFSADCTNNNDASIDSPVTTQGGAASSTFQDSRCSGNSERNDQIVATTLAGNQTLTATLPFTLQRQTLASLSFESAEPKQIRIKGAGGTGASESSLVSFKVTGVNGQAAAQQKVTFELDTVVGGLSFANPLANLPAKAESLTNSQGIASVRVLSGTVPTPVRVVASAVDTDTNEVITSQSEQLTVNTGLPQQLGFSLSSENPNSEANDIDGQTVSITARLSDSFGNPAPNDTTVNFTSEGGQIQPSCLTVNGACSVTWTSANPRTTDHRISVLAYALGHETFFDTNGNNQFDNADGGAIALACLNGNTPIACSGNGLDIETFHGSGFNDMPTAFRDDNENFAYDVGEVYFDNLGATSYSAADGKFNGPQCTASLCGSNQANKTYVRKGLVMSMSGSNAYFTLWQDDVKVYEDRLGQPVLNNLDALTPIATGQNATFTVQFYDSADQIMPSATTLAVTASLGDLLYTPFVVPKTNNKNAAVTDFSLTLGANDPAGISQVLLIVTTPSGVKSQLKFDVPLQ